VSRSCSRGATAKAIARRCSARSTAACGPAPGLTCAYALYNLGRSLRLAGRPAEAIPILQRRLQFADQRAAVQRELDQARRAAGIAPSPQAPSAPGAKDKGGKGHGGDGQGGEGG